MGCPEFPPTTWPLTPASPQTLLGPHFCFCATGRLVLSSPGSSEDATREQLEIQGGGFWCEPGDQMEAAIWGPPDAAL